MPLWLFASTWCRSRHRSAVCSLVRNGFESPTCLAVSECRITTVDPFVRITAYVVKVFSMAHSIIGVDKQQVCAPLLYLLKNKYDTLRSSFREDNPVYSPTITVSVCVKETKEYID